MAHPQSHPTSFISGIVDRSRILGASYCLPTSCAYYTAIDITSLSSRYAELRTDIGRKVFRSCLGIPLVSERNWPLRIWLGGEKPALREYWR